MNTKGFSAAPTKITSYRLFLLVIAAAVFTTTLTASMLNVILPVIRVEFGVSAAQVGWIITAYSLAYAVGVPLYGRISDLFGVRQVFVLGLLGFAVGGVICATAPNLPVIILGRFVQGAGGAAIPALSSIAIVKVLTPGERGGALGLVASAVGTGSAIGPVAGGLFAQFLGWRTLFIASVVLILLMIPLARRVLPNDISDDGEFDLLGGILFGSGAGFFLFGMTQGQIAGFTSVIVWGSFLIAALASIGFVWRINHARSPFISPRLFSNRAYVIVTLIGFCVAFAHLAAYVLVPLLIVEVNALPPSYAGLVLTPGALAIAFFSLFAGRLSDKVGEQLPMLVGLVVILLSLLLISTFAGGSPWLIALGVAGLGTGFAFFQSPANNAAANTLPDTIVGTGMGLFISAFFLGGGTGPALIGAFLAARQELGTQAINPYYGFDAAPYSDAFLAIIPVVWVAIAATLTLKRRVAATS